MKSFIDRMRRLNDDMLRILELNHPTEKNFYFDFGGQAIIIQEALNEMDEIWSKREETIKGCHVCGGRIDPEMEMTCCSCGKIVHSDCCNLTTEVCFDCDPGELA